MAGRKEQSIETNREVSPADQSGQELLPDGQHVYQEHSKV